MKAKQKNVLKLKHVAITVYDDFAKYYFTRIFEFDYQFIY